MLSLLTECTVLMLKAICEMYNVHRITYNEFISFTENKLQFLLENINSFSTEIERCNALDTLDKCNSIISENDSRVLMPSFHQVVGIIQ